MFKIRNTVKKILISAIVLFLFGHIQAQEGWESGGWIGGANYFGDLNTNFSFQTPGLAGGVVFRYNFNERTCIKFSGNFADVSADDANSDNVFEQARNLNFQSRIWDLTSQYEFNFLPYIHGSKTEFFTPYLLGGLTIFNFNPQTEYNGELVDLRPLGTEGQFKGEEYYRTQVGLAYGGGIKLSLGYYWSINIEIGARLLFTDYLDDVSTVFADPEDIANIRGEIAGELSNRAIDIAGVDADFSPGRQRGNSNDNDSYVMAGVSILYYFGDLKCPKILSR